ncbi:RNA polymerase sigma factor [Streptomyces sp. NPDC002533]
MAEHGEEGTEALGKVFEEYRAEMTGKARQLLLEADVPTSVVDADDIVSSAFATALRNPGAVRQPRAYVYKLMRTEILHLVTRRAEHRLLDAKRRADPLCCPPPYVADFSALVDNRQAVVRAMSGLSAPQRTAVWATQALGYTREETAVLTGRHPGTVARHTTRGMTLLRVGAAFAGALAVFGSAVGVRLQQMAPADRPPRTDPLLLPAQWWSENWVMLVALLLGACALWLVKRRFSQRILDGIFRLRRMEQGRYPRSLIVMLCPNCHVRMRRLFCESLSMAEERDLLRKARRTVKSAQRSASSVCQLCGGEETLTAPLEVAHVEPLSGLPLAPRQTTTYYAGGAHVDPVP